MRHYLLPCQVLYLVWIAASLDRQIPDNSTLWFIRPTISSGEFNCPSESYEQPCYSLQEILENSILTDIVFQPNTKIVFLSGTHVLEFNRPTFFTIDDIEALTMQGDGNMTTGLLGLPEPATKLICRSPVGIAFVNTTNLSLINMTISGCGATITERLNDIAFAELTHGVHVAGNEQKAALFLIKAQHLYMEQCSIQSSKGFGVLGVNVLGTSIIRQSIFLANNIYILDSDRCKFNPVDNSDYIACNGGNMLLLFEDLFECPSNKLHNSLTIESTIFAFGITTFSGYVSEKFLTRGSGFGAILSQSSYDIDIVLDSVASYGNGAAFGANFYFGVYEVVRNSSITLVSCSSLDGNNALVRTDNFLQVSSSVAAGLHLEYGTTAPDSSPQPVCSGPVSLDKEILTISSCVFANNSAVTAAGIYILLDLTDHIGQRGSSDQNIVVRVVVENSTFIDNQGLRGAGMYITESRTISARAQASVSINNSTFFRNANTLYPIRNLTGFAANYHYTVLELVSANVSITDTNFKNNEASAMSLFSSTALLAGRIIFDSNSGITGGAMYLENSFIYIRPDTNISFTNNFALRHGGAINTVDRTDIRLPCFYQIIDPNFLIDPNVHLYFEDNFAQEAGSLLYGGSIDSCYIEATSSFSGQSSMYVFDQITRIGYHSSDTSLISSEPARVCPCSNGVPDCGATTNIQVYPGSTFSTSIVAIGQRNGTTPAIIYSMFNPEVGKSGSISSLQGIQEAGKACSNFTFTVQTDSRISTVILMPSRNLLVDSNSNLVINVIILPCPTGFVLENGACVCDPVQQLADYYLDCDINTQTIHRPAGTWINASYEATTGAYAGIIVHRSCPYDYCNSNDSDVDLTNPDMQCNFNRTGILCGACKPGLSIPLATSQCKKCSNAYIAFLIAYALAGITLVALLFLLNLTLSMGTLGGLIFYANIVRINQNIFFPQGSLNIITVFIAWLNLDPGADYCFFDGMDSYARTWLNYAFPFYIWIIVIVIILASRYSMRVARFCGSTAVPVMASLILLSYTKLLRAVILSLTSTTILLPDNTYEFVWTSDGNLNFFKGKHIALALFANLVLLFFIVPYAIFLVVAPTPCGQFLTKYRPLKWINKLKPFLDAHTAHYKDSHRYWTGFLLLARVFIALFVSLNLNNISAIPLLVITILMFAVLTIALSGGGAYRDWPRNVLECSFFINLGILAVSTLFVLKIGGNQRALFYTSGTIALLEFVGITMYHVYCQVSKLSRVRKWSSAVVSKFKKPKKKKEDNFDLTESTQPVTHTTVSFREPLLDNVN